MKLFRSTLRVRMALLYGGLVLLVGVSLLFTSLVLLDRAISGVQFFKFPGYVTATPTNGGATASPRSRPNSASRPATVRATTCCTPA